MPDSFVQLAKRAIEHHLGGKGRLDIGDNVPEGMEGRAGVFVSIHKSGDLRGCIGTFLPTRGNIAEEIISNAVSAAEEDPRFPPVEISEMPLLEISVDVLSEPEPAVIEDLDPKKYGVIVRSGYKRGLLLPDLEGVDTPEQQIRICRMKAGIGEHEKIELSRFQVIRHH